jgi:hypothetical protein
MSSDEDESRSERLRRRRSQRQQPDESDERAEADETAEPSEPSETSKPSESVKDEQVGTYMYIPESQKKEIERLYNILKAEYEYEYDADFEKNRHFYPILVQYGLNGLDGLDASEIQDRLDSI